MHLKKIRLTPLLKDISLSNYLARGFNPLTKTQKKKHKIHKITNNGLVMKSNAVLVKFTIMYLVNKNNAFSLLLNSIFFFPFYIYIFAEQIRKAFVCVYRTAKTHICYAIVIIKNRFNVFYGFVERFFLRINAYIILLHTNDKWNEKKEAKNLSLNLKNLGKNFLFEVEINEKAN